MIKKNYHVKNEDLQAELEKSHENDQLTDRACLMFQKMIDHLSWKLPYKDPELKRDVQAFAMYICVKNWRGYDITRNSSFSFFTSTILNGLREGFKKYSPGKVGDVHIKIDSLIKMHNENS